jgi:acyl-CoA synthetase (AMP-forming)/AMP-acid ligase II
VPAALDLPAAPGLALDQGAITHWTAEGRTRLDRAGFWRLADRYLDLIASEPAVAEVGIVVSRTSLDMMALFVALIAAGRMAAFFPPRSARQDAEAYLEQQRAAALRLPSSSILTLEGEDAALDCMDPVLAGRALSLPRLSLRPEPTPASNGRAREGFERALGRRDAIFCQHSSGTTGIKKAVEISGWQLVGQFQAYWPTLQASLGEAPLRVASWLPLYHDMGLIAGFLLPLLGGAELALIDPFEWVEAPQLFLQMIEQEASTVSWMPNFAFRHFTRLRPFMTARDLGAMRLWISCSEPCRYVDALAFERAYAPMGVSPGSVVGCYAMAETVFAASQLEAGGQRALVIPGALKPGDEVLSAGARETTDRDLALEAGEQALLCSGAPIPGLEVQVFVDGRAAADGVYGEIGLRGGFVFGGYRGQSTAHSNIGNDGFYRTGDLGVILDGRLYVFGRTKEMVIVNGKNLYLGDVEDRVGSAPGVRPGRAVAFGLDNAALGTEDLIIVAERDAGAALTDADIRAGITTAVMDAFLVKPHDVQIVLDRWLVKTTSGKISRTSNRAKYLRDFGSTADVAAAARGESL